MAHERPDPHERRDPVARAAAASWRLAGVADWNGDNGADLVWQNTSTGAVEIWYLNGTAFASSAAVSPSRPAVWQVAGAADWNGDGKPDLLWQNQSTGDLEVWYMNGTTRAELGRAQPVEAIAPVQARCRRSATSPETGSRTSCSATRSSATSRSG